MMLCSLCCLRRCNYIIAKIKIYCYVDHFFFISTVFVNINANAFFFLKWNLKIWNKVFIKKNWHTRTYCGIYILINNAKSSFITQLMVYFVYHNILLCRQLIIFKIYFFSSERMYM